MRWYLDVDDATTGGLAGWILPDGRLVVGGGQGSPPSIRTLSGDVLYQVPPADQIDPGYHHEALLSPEGLARVAARAGDVGLDGVGFEGFRIEAWDPRSDTLAWSFASQPQVDRGLLVPTPGDDDPFHANAVVFADDVDGPAVWVSLRGLGTLMRIDRDSAEVTGFFGPDRGVALQLPDGTAAADTEWFWGQHAPQIQGDLVTVYDNGGRRPGGLRYSRIARYRQLAPDRAELVWDWTEPGWYETNFGSVIDVPDTDGHVLVGTGHCGSCPPAGDASWIAEVDPATGSVVWRFDFVDDAYSVYRAQPLSGCGLFANRRYCPGIL
ncbi:MAG: aryl-sulfate sulfotransferase [Myxococcota bacterium]